MIQANEKQEKSETLCHLVPHSAKLEPFSKKFEMFRTFSRSHPQLITELQKKLGKNTCTKT